MPQGNRGTWARGMLMLGCLLLCRGGAAQSVTAAPSLDLNRFMGIWYVEAHAPSKFEKRCVDNETMLYALDDGKNSFQVGTFCPMQNGTTDQQSASGSVNKKALGTGRLQLTHLVLLHRKYWVLATAPDYAWALVGTPNRKSLWILSRVAEMPADTLAQAKSQASAQGFHTDKLLIVPQKEPTAAELGAGK